MIKHLTKHGNSYAIIIDKPILEILKANPKTAFEVITDGSSLVLTPVRNKRDQKQLRDALDDVHTRFGRAMEKLAE